MTDTDARARVEQELFLRSFMPINLPARMMAQVTSVMRDVRFQPGAVLYRMGEPAAELFFIVDGLVELQDEEGKSAEFDKNSMVGILDAATDGVYSRTAVALRRTHCLALRFSDYIDVLEDNFEQALQMISTTSKQNNDLALQLGGEHVFTCLDRVAPQPLTHLQPGQTLGAMSRLLALRATPMFSRAPIQSLARLAQLAKPRQVPAHESVFEAGQPSRELQVLVDGRVRMHRKDVGVDAVLHPTRVLGGLTAFAHDVRFYNANTEENSLVLVIAKEDLYDVMEDHFGLVRSLLSEMASQRAALVRVGLAASVRFDRV